MNLMKYTQQVNSPEILKWINSNLKNYLQKNPENVGEIEHILDYLQARETYCRERNRSFNLIKMSYPQALNLSKKWVETLKKKGRDIVETESDVEEVLKWKSGVRLVKLISADAYKREGHLMSHCVASYYSKKVDVYSLRDSKNRPHCTIEINSENVNQIKGKGNGSIHPKYIKYILKILKHFKKDVRKSELSYLGYREVSSRMFNFYNSKVKNLKHITYQGSQFIYVHQKFERS